MKKLTTLMLLVTITFIPHGYAREASDMSNLDIANIRQAQKNINTLRQRLGDFETNILTKDTSFNPQFEQLKSVVDGSWDLLEKTIKELTERKFISVESFNYYLDLLATYKKQITLSQDEINNRKCFWQSCRTVKDTLAKLAIDTERELSDAIIIVPFPRTTQTERPLKKPSLGTRDPSDLYIANLSEAKKNMGQLKQRLIDFETNILKKDRSFKPQFDELKGIVDDSLDLLEKTIKELTERKFISVESFNYYLDLLATYKKQITLSQDEINNRKCFWPSCRTVKNTLTELAIDTERELSDAIIIVPFPQK